jgi:glucose-6-phosphate isomerase
MNNQQWIERNRKYTLTDPESGFSLAVAGMKFTAEQLQHLSARFEAAHREMQKLEAGAIKNPDENRKVTHFTDRADYTASPLFREVQAFAEAIAKGEITGGAGRKFESAVINGIGGSALGPQLMQYAINGPYWNELSDAKRRGFLKLYFLDNTDSAGFADLTATIDPETTLVVNISKSGGTQETKNNTAALQDFFKSKNVDFAPHFAAITMKDSSLDRQARAEKWFRVFDMAESIGGRTSETSVVGHLPAALTGINFKSFIDGACAMDRWTRNSAVLDNPAYLMAALWYIAGNGKGDRNLVIVPYSDRLILLSRYFQQLIMESVGKELDLDGKTVHQGLNVFGNKGGTDAHAFIQQLNDGRDDFFVTFIEVLKNAMPLPVGENMDMGNYLHGFLAGLSSALRSKGRQVMQITISEISPYNLGMIIALYERTVAVYAELIHINAFHQPGVQAYKLAAKEILDLRAKVLAATAKAGGASGTAAEIAAAIGLPGDEVEIAGLFDKASANCPCVSRAWDPARKTWIYTVK